MSISWVWCWYRRAHTIAWWSLAERTVGSVAHQHVLEFFESPKFGNNANIGMRGFYNVKAKNSSNKMLPSVNIEPLNLWFQVQHSPFWTNLAFACKTETLGYLYSHAQLILTKSKNQWFMNRSLKIYQVANARLTQKGECWTWNQRLIRCWCRYWHSSQFRL